MAIAQINPAQTDQQQQRRQHEQSAGDDAAPASMHQPADVGGQLLRFRPRQQHAIIQRIQETPFGYPAPLFHQLLMHNGDLPGRPAETDEAESQPDASTDMPALLETARPAIRSGATWMLKQGGSLTLALLEFLLSIILAGFLCANEAKAKSLVERLIGRMAGQ
jgi:hypothetical protein